MYQVLRLPNGETLILSRDEARAVVGDLWLTMEPGAAPMAVKLIDASSRSPLYGRVVEVSERELTALRGIMPDFPTPPA